MTLRAALGAGSLFPNSLGSSQIILCRDLYLQDLASSEWQPMMSTFRFLNTLLKGHGFLAVRVTCK